MSEDCPYCQFEKTDNCRGCWEGSHYKPKPITNSDRLRAMTDEGLARIIVDDWCAIVCEDTPFCDGKCESRVLDWLKSEVKE